MNKDVEVFLKKIVSDSDLGAKVKKMRKKYPEQKLSLENTFEFVTKGLIPLAKEFGYNFTWDDYVVNQVKTESKSLDDNDLADVGGGVSLKSLGAFSMLMLMGMGAAAPMLSSKAANNTKNNNRRTSVVQQYGAGDDIDEKIINTENKEQANIDLIQQDSTSDTITLAEFKQKQNNYEGYYGKHGDNVHRNAYLAMAKQDAASLTQEEAVAMDEYTNDSSSINWALRSGSYSSGEADEALIKTIDNIKSAFSKHELEENITTFRGVSDGMITYLLGTANFEKEQISEMLDEQGRLNHKEFYAKEGYKLLEGIEFQDDAFVSTTTNEFFAKRWSNEIVNKARREEIKATGNKKALAEEMKKYRGRKIYSDTVGSHLFVVNIEKGTRAMFVDTMFTRTGSTRGQNELTLDAGYKYKINSVTALSEGRYQFNVSVVQ